MKNHLYLYPNIVKVRKRKMTQAQLASHIGISQQEISRYESGEVKAPINYLIDLADCCGVSIDYILGIDNQKSDHTPDEKHILSLYSMLSDEDKLRVTKIMKLFIDIENEK